MNDSLARSFSHIFSHLQKTEILVLKTVAGNEIYSCFILLMLCGKPGLQKKSHKNKIFCIILPVDDV